MKLRRLDHDDSPADANLRSALERAGLRLTRQRASIYSYLRSTTSHPTAEQVFAAVREVIPHISLGTVYKALEALVAAGVAARVEGGNGPTRYDGRSEPHYHYRCPETGRVCDLPLPYDPQFMDKLAPDLAEELRDCGFVVTGHRLELLGHFLPR